MDSKAEWSWDRLEFLEEFALCTTDGFTCELRSTTAAVHIMTVIGVSDVSHESWSARRSPKFRVGALILGYSKWWHFSFVSSDCYN
jgi:hypothetical protein